MGGGSGGQSIRFEHLLQRAPLKSPLRFSTLGALTVLGLLVACRETAGPRHGASQLAVEAGNDQGANVGTALAQPLSVVVTNADNEPIADVAVTFTVRTGGGTIVGGSARTGANGIATSGAWTLGANLGTNTVEASAPGLPSVTFTAIGRCAITGTIALDATITGTLSTGDCRYPAGELTERFTFTTTEQRAVRFFQRSNEVDTYLEIYDNRSLLLSANDDSADVSGATTSAVKMLLAPGTYEISPSSFLPAEVGQYSLTAMSVPESENTCELIFAMPGISTVGALGAGDCTIPGTPVTLIETVALVLRVGRTYTITLNSTAFDAVLELGIVGGPRVAFSDNAVGTNARIVYTPPISNFYVIVVRPAVAGTSGAYTLIIE